MTMSRERKENGGEDPNLIDIRIVDGDSDYEAEEEEEEEDGMDTSQDLPKITPVDGGYGWMIVLACWVMHVLVGGWNRGYGVMYVEFRHRFQSSAAVTAWVGGACAAARMAFSPVATSLSNRFSAQKVVFCGGIVLGVSAVLNGFAPNIYYLFFTHALLGGFGGSLVYAPCIVMVSQYFDKRRSLALGIATSGSGLGLFLFPPLLELLFLHYGYMGTMLLGGALLFHNSISGALLRPLQHSQHRSVRIAHRLAATDSKPNKETAKLAATDSKPHKETAKLVATDSKHHKETAKLAATDSKPHKETAKLVATDSEPHKETAKLVATDSKPHKETAKLAATDSELHKETAKLAATDSQLHKETAKLAQYEHKEVVRDSKLNNTKLSQSECHATNKVDGTEFTQTRDSTHKTTKTGDETNIKKIPNNKNSESELTDSKNNKQSHLQTFSKYLDLEKNSETELMNTKKEDKQSHLQTFSKYVDLEKNSETELTDSKNNKQSHLQTLSHYLDLEKMTSKSKNSETELMDTKNNKKSHLQTLSHYLDLSLWHEPAFVMFVLSLTFATSCYFSAQYLMVALAHSRGVPLAQGSFLLSIVGIMDMLTRLGSGVVFSCARRHQQLLYNAALLLTGTSALLCVAAPGFGTLAALAALHGVGCGVVTAQRAAMVADLVGVGRVASSFGLTVCVQGIGLVAGPAFAGYLRDVSGGYEWSYVFTGLCGLTAALLYFLNLRCFYHRRPMANNTGRARH